MSSDDSAGEDGDDDDESVWKVTALCAWRSCWSFADVYGSRIPACGGSSDVRYSVPLSYHVFQITVMPWFVWEKYTVCTEFGDEKPRFTSLESDVLPSSKMHVLGYTIGL